MEELHISTPTRIRKGWDTAVSEETIFGIVSRHHSLTGNPFSSWTNYELTDNGTAYLSLKLPSSLNKIFARLRLSIDSVSDLIKHHTTLPYFQPFIKASHYERVFHGLENGSVRFSRASLGISTGAASEGNLLRFCPECGKEDEEDIGVATWYRVHQLPGVLVCPYHGVPLNVSVDSPDRKRRGNLFLPNSTKADRNYYIPTAEGVNEKLLLIARLSAQALMAEPAEDGLILLRKQYLASLYDKGLTTQTFHIKKNELVKELVNFWSEIRYIDPFRTWLNEFFDPAPWPAVLCHESRASHPPLKHLLMIGFLGKNLRSFLRPIDLSVRSIVQPARGESEAIQLQIRSLYDKGNSLKRTAEAIGLSVKTTRSKAARLGIFYKFRTLRVRACVRSKVRFAVLSGEPISNIVRATNLPPHIIVNILESAPSVADELHAAHLEERKMSSRNNILAAIMDSAFAGFWSLSKTVPADFHWLYRNDKKWLMDQKRFIEEHF